MVPSGVLVVCMVMAQTVIEPVFPVIVLLVWAHEWNASADKRQILTAKGVGGFTSLD